MDLLWHHRIVCGHSPDELRNRLQKFRADGWEPVGDAVPIKPRRKTDSVQFCQTLRKPRS